MSVSVYTELEIAARTVAANYAAFRAEIERLQAENAVLTARLAVLEGGDADTDAVQKLRDIAMALTINDVAFGPTAKE